MKKINILLLACLIIMFFSCSKNDDTTSNEQEQQEIEEPLEPEIGIKFFGQGMNSVDQGVAIYKTADGYISFENRNRATGAMFGNYEGEGDIIVRRLDNELELITEYVLDTFTNDVLLDVEKIDDNTFVMIGRTITDDFFDSNSVPFLNIVNANGEVISSTLLGIFKEYTDTLNAEITFKNGVVYATAGIGLRTVLITALDIDLNEIWRNSFNIDLYPNGSVLVNNDELLFAFEDGPDYARTIFLKRFSTTTGELISTYEYDSVTAGNQKVEKLVIFDNVLYVAGNHIRQISTRSNISQFVRINLDDWSEIDRVYRDDIYINEINISQNDIIIAGAQRIQGNGMLKVNNLGEPIWESNVFLNGVINNII